MHVIISEFGKNAVKQIRVTPHSDSDIRLMGWPIHSHEDPSEWPPAKTGITLTIEQQPQLLDHDKLGEGDAGPALMLVDIPYTNCGNALL
jgi:hypothetical protein